MDKIGPYRVEQQLLTTSFSDIYVVFRESSDSPLALKVFHPKGKNVGSEAKYGPDFWRARFLEEGRILSQIDHPQIVPVIDQGFLDSGEPYFVMPFMEANLLYEIGHDPKDWEEDVAEKWRPRPISPRRASVIWEQVLSGLAEVHRRGLVHRDVKPHNVLLDSKQEGRVRICDFGMVKVPGAQGSRSGIWVGTRDYMSPEQRKSAKEVDARSDVYSAGVLMYRMLTGRLPEKRRAPLRAGRVKLPQPMVDLIEACLRRDSSSRPATAGDVLSAMRTVLPDFSTLSDTSNVSRRGSMEKIKTHKKTV